MSAKSIQQKLTLPLAVANGGTGNTTGLAASATKLATTRAINSAVTNLASTAAGAGVNFDGSSAVTIPSTGVGGTLPIANGGTGATTASAALAALGGISNGTFNIYPAPVGTHYIYIRKTNTPSVFRRCGLAGSNVGYMTDIDLISKTVYGYAMFVRKNDAGMQFTRYNSRLYFDMLVPTIRDFWVFVIGGVSEIQFYADGADPIAGLATYVPINNADYRIGTVAVANGGTGLTAANSVLTNLATTAAASIFAEAPRPGVTGILPIANGGTNSDTLPIIGTIDVPSNMQFEVAPVLTKIVKLCAVSFAAIKLNTAIPAHTQLQLLTIPDAFTNVTTVRAPFTYGSADYTATAPNIGLCSLMTNMLLIRTGNVAFTSGQFLFLPTFTWITN
jgi:hypothetical protein